MTRNRTIALVIATLLVAAFAGTSQAQYYGYWYNYAPGYNAPPPQQRNTASPPDPLLYRMAPNPQLFRQWDHQIRIWDFLELQRGPLNQETTLDYMMRTF